MSDLGANIPPASTIDGAEHLHSGKVRDLYRLANGNLLMVASDRISAFDWVLPSTIPDKGAILTRMSLWWFDQLKGLVPNHVLSTEVPSSVRGRALVCEPLEMFPVECVVRGYLTGSGLVDYQRTGSVCGVPLPEGLEDGSRLEQPVFTPATKAAVGDHDENVSFEEVAVRLGGDLAAELRMLSLAVYEQAERVAREQGIILADTKLEFGTRPDGTVVLADEVLTPDSSRFWPADGYEVGRGQPSFDKQYVRDWASGSGWDKTPPAPALPSKVVDGTRARYLEAYERIAGEPFKSWLERAGG